MIQPLHASGFDPSKSEMAMVLSNLSFAYPDREHTVQNVNLKIRNGERVGIIGPNGAGKTTLFLLICGILTPTAGQIALFGEPIIAVQI